MKLILQKDVKNLGKAGDQVSVKNGFARNFLLPKGYALLLNKDCLKAWNHQKTIITAKKRKAVAERKALIERLSSIKLVFEKESQKDNKIFGSVTAYEISQALEEKHKISVDKRDIHFSELKTVGNHKIRIRLDSECQTEILLTIKGKIRKKREAFIKRTDKEKELISAKTEPLPESAESKSAVSKEELAVGARDKTEVKESQERDKAEVKESQERDKAEVKESQERDKAEVKESQERDKAEVKESQEQTAEKIASSSKIESEKSQVSVEAVQSEADEKSQLQNKFEKRTVDGIKTVKASSETGLGDSRKAESKKQEEAKAEKGQKAKQAKSSSKTPSQSKSKPEKESKKTGGFFKKLFGGK